ncbi:MAG: RNA polymerase sigma factor [Actinomycetota bacterium]
MKATSDGADPPGRLLGSIFDAPPGTLKGVIYAARNVAGASSSSSSEQGQASEEDVTHLVEEHIDSIYRLALSLVRDSALAEDVVQETLIKVWRALPAFRGDSSLRRWVLTITHNTAVSLMRAAREEAHDPNDLPDAPVPNSIEKTVQDNLAIEQLWNKLGELDETTRALVVLRDLEGLSYEELCGILGLPLPTVRTRLFRARRKLAAAMEEWRQ